MRGIDIRRTIFGAILAVLLVLPAWDHADAYTPASITGDAARYLESQGAVIPPFEVTMEPLPEGVAAETRWGRGGPDVIVFNSRDDGASLGDDMDTAIHELVHVIQTETGYRALGAPKAEAMAATLAGGLRCPALTSTVGLLISATRCNQVATPPAPGPWRLADLLPTKPTETAPKTILTGFRGL